MGEKERSHQAFFFTHSCSISAFWRHICVVRLKGSGEEEEFIIAPSEHVITHSQAWLL